MVADVRRPNADHAREYTTTTHIHVSSLRAQHERRRIAVEAHVCDQGEDFGGDPWNQVSYKEQGLLPGMDETVSPGDDLSLRVATTGTRYSLKQQWDNIADGRECRLV